MLRRINKSHSPSEKFLTFLRTEEGATAVEYAIMASAIAAVIVAVTLVIGEKTNNSFELVKFPPE